MSNGKHPGGRPLKFESVQEFEQKVREYFYMHRKGGEAEGVPMTISGLAYHLDVCTQTLINYEEKGEFFAPIKRAKQLIEMQYEQGLRSTTPTGCIFALKNFGWKDRSDHTLSGDKDNPIRHVDLSSLTTEQLIALDAIATKCSEPDSEPHEH